MTLLVSSAAAKEAPTALRVCGVSGCVTVGDAESARSIWTDAWVARRGSLVRRDGQVVAVSPDLAAKARRGQSLRMSRRAP